jgi:hypothetical protein
MEPARSKKVPPAKRLGILAMQFRGTRDNAERASISEAYTQTVNELIESKKWKRMPPLEDQLPDQWMPEAFFAYWSLSLPPRRIGERA